MVPTQSASVILPAVRGSYDLGAYMFARQSRDHVGKGARVVVDGHA